MTQRVLSPYLKGLPFGGLPRHLLARMQEILNTADFVKVNRSAEAATIGIPKGYIGASISKLLQTGQLNVTASGWLELVSI